MKTRYTFKWFAIIVIILPLFFLIQPASTQIASAVDYQYDTNQPKASVTYPTKKEEKLTHEEVISITNKFEDLLVQETDDTFKVTHYNTKGELLDAFEKIVSRDQAKRFVDFYYYEKPDGLYIVPTELPPWLNEANDYDMIEIENNKVKVVQENKSNFHGDYTVALEFTFDGNKWRITNIVYA